MHTVSTLASLGLTLLFSSIAMAEDVVESHIQAVGGKEAIAKIGKAKPPMN